MPTLALSMGAHPLPPVPPACDGNCSYRTSTGAVFERVDTSEFIRRHPGFGKAWKAPNGTIWSERQGGRISYWKPKEVSRLCKAVGGQLPTRNDYEALASFFEKDQYGASMTQKGLGDLWAIFPDMHEPPAANGDIPYAQFWTSTPVTSSTMYYTFDPFDGRSDVWPPQMSWLVRCIAHGTETVF